jgi:hypothetical protein
MEQHIEIKDELLIGWTQNIYGRSKILNFRLATEISESALPGRYGVHRPEAG